MLYSKYRPLEFSQVKGQDSTVTSLKNALTLGKLHHAILFCGPRGLGKTTLARIVAKCVNCLKSPMSESPCGECESCLSITKGNFIDVIEIDAASNRGIDEIRQLKERVNYKPAQGVKKIFIIDEVHMLTTEAFNALLKTLEEPPVHVMFILATTDPEKLPETILSRCQRFDLSSVKYSELKSLLSDILQKEGVTVEDEVYKILFERSGGSIRDSLTLMEKLILSAQENHLTLKNVEDNLGFVSAQRFQFFENIILSNQISSVLELIDELWLEGIEIDDFFKQYCFYLKSKSFKEEGVKLEWIEEILSVLYHLKNEEDKRLLGYVIVHRIRELEFGSKRVSKKVSTLPLPREERVFNREISAEELSEKWDELLTILKRKRIVMVAYLSGSVAKGISGENILIELPKGHQFHLDALSKLKNREYLEEVLFEVFNMPLKMEFSFEEGGEVVVEDDLLKTVMDVFGGGEIIKK